MQPLFLPTLLSFLAVITGCRRGDTPAALTEPAPIRAQIAIARTERVPAIIAVPATIRPVERAAISAKLTGTVVTFSGGLGQEVRQGDTLLTLSTPETDARVRQAQARLAESERATERERTLVAKGVNPPDSLRDAEDRLRFAQATLAAAEALLAYATLRAPFTGVITEKHVLPGDLASPGQPLLTLESTSRLRAEGTVPELAAASLRIGDPLALSLDDHSAPITGTIEELSRAADAISRSVLVKVALPANAGRSGQFARLLVTTGQNDAILVPAGALTRFGQMERLFVVRDGRAELRLIKTGRSLGESLEILSGLTAGETVIVHSPAALRDGTPVTAAP